MTEAAVLATLAAIVQGDRWLSADACAVYLGLRAAKGGLPNRRAFLERIACQPGFPEPLVLGQDKVWKRSEIDRWAETQRRLNRVA